jgi:iron complex transport system substrate-binding protein
MLVFASALLGALPATASVYPLTVRSCDRQVVFEQAPSRAVSHDVNMTGIMLALGLTDRMAGYTGISGWKTLAPAMRDALDGLPELARRYPSIETLLNANADFFFAGWSYGMRIGGPVTPQTLAPLGIPVYELTESCSHTGSRVRASLDDVYRDITTIGQIFSVEDRAEGVVDEMRTRISRAAARIAPNALKPRVFLYDSGEDRPMTSGRLGMPQALIEAAGGISITEDVAASWTQVGWESIVARNPEVIVIVDYGPTTWQQKRDFLLAQPALADVDAIKQERFVVLPYVGVTPSVQNAEAIEILTAALHPQDHTAQP